MCNGNHSLLVKAFENKDSTLWRKSILTLMYVPTPTYAVCGECKKPGVEIEIFKLLCDHLNIKSNFIEQEHLTTPDFFNNYNQDILIGARAQMPNVFVDFTIPYIEDYVKWIVPGPVKFPNGETF
ncbi:hypothetical protein HHI36_011154 [Cryptolaemus montrouzieri]|uniref:Uncharacterized protein n=1 Tax=Cryptolaemus montrouzieri TaxID=559131 RepID=A0ABD2MKW4_9CUCU